MLASAPAAGEQARPHQPLDHLVLHVRGSLLPRDGRIPVAARRRRRGRPAALSAGRLADGALQAAADGLHDQPLGALEVLLALGQQPEIQPVSSCSIAP